MDTENELGGRVKRKKEKERKPRKREKTKERKQARKKEQNRKIDRKERIKEKKRKKTAKEKNKEDSAALIATCQGALPLALLASKLAQHCRQQYALFPHTSAEEEQKLL